MKKHLKFLITSFLMLSFFTPIKANSNIKLNSKYFPDKALRKSLKESNADLFSPDKNQDGYLSDEELNIEELAISERGIYDTTGIKYFKNLKKLSIWDNKWPRTKKINMSGFSYLKELEELTINGEMFYELNLENLYADKVTVFLKNKIVQNGSIPLTALNKKWNINALKDNDKKILLGEDENQFPYVIYTKKDGSKICIEFMIETIFSTGASINRGTYDTNQATFQPDYLADLVEVYRENDDSLKKIKTCRYTKLCTFNLKKGEESNYVINTYNVINDEKIFIRSYKKAFDNRVPVPAINYFKFKDSNIFYSIRVYDNTKINKYQIFLTTSKNGKYEKVLTTTQDEGVISINKKYKYVKVRAYKNKAGKVIYSNFSLVEKVG